MSEITLKEMFEKAHSESHSRNEYWKIIEDTWAKQERDEISIDEFLQAILEFAIPMRQAISGGFQTYFASYCLARKTVDSIWLFPSPVKKEDVPRDPSACRKALARILKRAECEHVPFHAMRHTFASNAFHYGMDVKTLASTIGHESVETTLNVYAHSSEQMKRDAAKKIDEAIGTVLGADVTASDASSCDENGEAQEPTSNADKPKTVEFKPYQPKYRKRGTGSVHQVSKNVWEGRYTPTVNGKRIARNIYADSEEECEKKLEALIQEMKAEFGIK